MNLEARIEAPRPVDRKHYAVVQKDEIGSDLPSYWATFAGRERAAHRFALFSTDVKACGFVTSCALRHTFLCSNEGVGELQQSSVPPFLVSFWPGGEKSCYGVAPALRLQPERLVG